MKHTAAYLSTVLALAAFGACLEPDPVPRFTPAWEPFDPTGEGWLASKKAHIVSDCQFHNLNSLPVPERNLSAESAIATAIRSPQLDLFSRDVLAWILENGAPDADLILHLGDALDLACEGEFEAFLEVMEAAGKPWFMAPGNHDCFYFGVFDPERAGLWEAACHGSGRPLHKDLFIRLYVAALVRRQDADGQALAEALGLSAQVEQPLAEVADLLPASFEWVREPGSYEDLAAIAWNVNAELPWRSFVLQNIDLTKDGKNIGRSSAVLLLDSSQFARRPILIPNGWSSYPTGLNSGSGGEMLPDQLRVARRWMEESESEFSLAFHHPFTYLAPRARSSVGWLSRELNAGFILTAHTHRGYYEHHDLGGERDSLELNIASTTDWPMEWRVLTSYGNLELEEFYVVAERHTLVDEISNREGFFLRGWEIPLDAPDDYRRYKVGQASAGTFLSYYYAYHLIPYWLPQARVRASGAAKRTEEQVKQTLLWTYIRLLEMFPTDTSVASTAWPAGITNDADLIAHIAAVHDVEDAIKEKIALLIQLERFERSRSSLGPDGESSDDVRRRYKISQAAWASRFEKSQGRRLRLEDEVIRVKWETSALAPGADGSP